MDFLFTLAFCVIAAIGYEKVPYKYQYIYAFSCGVIAVAI